MYKIKYPIYITIIIGVVSSFIFTATKKEVQDVQKVDVIHTNDQLILNDKYILELQGLQIKLENEKKTIIDEYNTLIIESENERKLAISELSDRYRKLNKTSNKEHIILDEIIFERDQEKIKDTFQSRKYHLSSIKDSKIKKLNTLFSIDSEKIYSKYSHHKRDNKRADRENNQAPAIK